jgi:hypothetical protein
VPSAFHHQDVADLDAAVGELVTTLSAVVTSSPE